MQLLKQLKNKNSFLSHVATLTSGTVVAQAIAVIASPVLTRIYSPAEMGALAGVLAIVSILGTVAAGRYDLAIVLPEEDYQAGIVATLGLVVAGGFFVAVTGGFALFRESLTRLLGFDDIPVIWVQLIGLLVFLVGAEHVLNRVAIRNRHYRVMAATQVGQQLLNNVTKVGLGLLGAGVSGLFNGALISHLVRVGRLSWTERATFLNAWKTARLSDYRETAKRYGRFPLVSSWSALLNSTSTQAPVILFTALFSPAVAGYYALSHRILKLPMSLVGTSVANVFLERAARAKDDPEQLQRITLSLYTRLLFIGALTMSFVTFYGDVLFAFVFGEQWVEAGRYSQWISTWLVLQLASTPLSTLYTVTEKQGEALVWQLGLAVTRLVPIAIIAALFDEPYISVVTFSLASLFLYGVLCVRVLNLARVPASQIVYRTVLSGGTVFLIQAVLRFLFVTIGAVS